MYKRQLHGDAYILETAFNPWQVAVKLSSKEEVVRLQQENPQRLLDALDVITQSHINHAKRAFAAGASGVLFSICLLYTSPTTFFVGRNGLVRSIHTSFTSQASRELGSRLKDDVRNEIAQLLSENVHVAKGGN